MITNPPDDLLTITVNKVSREFHMSFGLLNELMKVIQDIGQVALLAIDPDLRTAVLTEVLAERDIVGKITGPISMFALEMSSEDVNALTEWVAKHTLHFFLMALASAVKVHAPYKEELEALTYFGHGSVNSPGEKPSVGLGTSPQAVSEP